MGADVDPRDGALPGDVWYCPIRAWACPRMLGQNRLQSGAPHYIPAPSPMT